eukprot:8062794-Pyramimonas_sp.AAC.1
MVVETAGGLHYLFPNVSGTDGGLLHLLVNAAEADGGLAHPFRMRLQRMVCSSAEARPVARAARCPVPVGTCTCA